MRFEEWEPYYTRILDDFHFSRGEDERAARILQELAPRDDLALLTEQCAGRHVTVCGRAPGLKEELAGIQGVVFAADGAANTLFDRGILPDAIFTDLDGATWRYLEMNREGTVIVVHAHGDNIPLLERWVRRFTGPFVATTQSAPLPGVYNFGGFSDGDRAAFAADSLGAASISFVGFDLDDRSARPVKQKKLAWARVLLRTIGYEL